jgi:hypothetical protein
METSIRVLLAKPSQVVPGVGGLGPLRSMRGSRSWGKRRTISLCRCHGRAPIIYGRGSTSCGGHALLYDELLRKFPRLRIAAVAPNANIGIKQPPWPHTINRLLLRQQPVGGSHDTARQSAHELHSEQDRCVAGNCRAAGGYNCECGVAHERQGTPGAKEARHVCCCESEALGRLPRSGGEGKWQEESSPMRTRSSTSS